MQHSVTMQKTYVVMKKSGADLLNKPTDASDRSSSRLAVSKVGFLQKKNQD
jgi:hypothetical protein